MSLSELLLSLKSYFKTNYDIIDNNMCRMHYKASAAILLAFSILVTAKQYIGDPIDCVVPKDSIDVKMLDTYCWIHKTFSVEKAFRGDLDTEVAYPGVAAHRPGDKLIYHSYYQWVCFVLFLQAMAFRLPRFIWRTAEGNRVKHLCTELEKPVQMRLLVDYMKRNKDGHRFYFGGLVAIEVLYLVNVLVQMYVMDVFLGGEFSKYGWKVLTFSEWHWEARYDPMIKVFPRMAKCTFRMYGTSGDIQRMDAVCVLPINIINEKIYVFLWFWFVGLAILTAAWMVYRAATIFLPSLRYRLLCRSKAVDGRLVQHFLNVNPDPGDWFVLYQVSKNIDVCFLNEFLERFSGKEIKDSETENSETEKLIEPQSKQ